MRALKNPLEERVEDRIRPDSGMVIFEVKDLPATHRQRNISN